MYSYVVNAARGGTAGKPGKPIQSNVDGALVLVYEVEEVNAGPITEFVIDCLPVVGRVTLYEVAPVGRPAEYCPEFGTAPGFRRDTIDDLDAGLTASRGAIRVANLTTYTSPTTRLVVRSRSDGGDLRHRITITEGHAPTAPDPEETPAATSSLPAQLDGGRILEQLLLMNGYLARLTGVSLTLDDLED